MKIILLLSAFALLVAAIYRLDYERSIYKKEYYLCEGKTK